MVSAPVKSAPVNDPKNEGTPGAQVRMMAPKKSGTIIIPPGIRSIVRLMGICTMAGLAGAWRRADLVGETCCSSACNSTSHAVVGDGGADGPPLLRGQSAARAD